MSHEPYVFGCVSCRQKPLYRKDVGAAAMSEEKAVRGYECAPGRPPRRPVIPTESATPSRNPRKPKVPTRAIEKSGVWERMVDATFEVSDAVSARRPLTSGNECAACMMCSERAAKGSSGWL